jgi:V/A-type H+-transporting ATPase subunit I
MINRIRARDWKGVFLEKTGLPGISFYWGALVLLAGGGLLGLRITPALVLLLTGVPLLVLFLREPLYGLFSRTALFPHGVFSFIMEGVVELIDTLSYFMGNTVSFVRVGAFALAHSGLSLAFMKLFELVGGGIGGITVLVFGNLLIIVLEGMVVSIQTMRLEYYEFFSKFYSGSGHPFTPFRLAAGKGA